VSRSGGFEVDTQGDAFFCVFGRARDAVSAAVDVQRALHEHAWPNGVHVAVRIGIHTGEPELTEDRYFGMDVHRAARICAVASGGEIVLSELSATLVRDHLPDGASLVPRGEARLKGFDGRERLYRIAVDGLPELVSKRGEAWSEPFAGAHDTLAERAAQLPLEGDRAGETAIRRLLVAAPDVEGLRSLVPFACCIAGRRTDIILACLAPPHADLRHATAALAELGRRLRHENIILRVVALHAIDTVHAIDKLARAEEVDCVLADGRPMLDGAEPDRLLRSVTCDVLIHVPRDDPPARGPVVVPFSGSQHDWAAVELATLLSQGRDAPILLVGSEPAAAGGEDASRILAAASLVVQKLSGVIPEPMLVEPGVDGVLHVSSEATHIVTGVADDFAESGLGGTRREIARRSRAPTTFVRRGETSRARLGATMTRFTWT
jgi:hypothetical protein